MFLTSNLYEIEIQISESINKNNEYIFFLFKCLNMTTFGQMSLLS